MVRGREGRKGMVRGRKVRERERKGVVRGRERERGSDCRT